MKNMARNISLLVNAFLLILIATGALWALKELHRQEPDRGRAAGEGEDLLQGLPQQQRPGFD